MEAKNLFLVVAKAKYLYSFSIMKRQEGSFKDNGAHYMRGCVQVGASASTKWCTFVSHEDLDRRSQSDPTVSFHLKCIPVSSATRLVVFYQLQNSCKGFLH